MNNSEPAHLPDTLAVNAKYPPHALDLEEGVLGALMLEKEALVSVIDLLRPESFYKESHQEIYRAIVRLFNDSEPIDMLTVVNQLRKDGKLATVGGSYYVSYLTTRISSSANIEFHARAILEYAMRRKLIEISSMVQKHAYDPTMDIFNTLDRTEQALFEVSDGNVRKRYLEMRSLLVEAFDNLSNRRTRTNGLTGIPSGFTALDRITSGWQKFDLIIIAARPGMGKTAFVLSALRNAAIDYKTPVAIFSLEMGALQLVNRLISAEAELAGEKIKQGKLMDHEWEQLLHKTAELSNAPIYVDDTPALSVFELRTKCRRLKAKHDIQLVVIDYLQLMSGDQNRGGGNREQEIASISRALKSIAKELDIAVVALSQLSRAVETRGGSKRPQLSDLRESGSIEQDADLVLFLYRPEYYGLTEDESGNPTQGLAEVIVAKHRNGALDQVHLQFMGRYMKFMDVDMPPAAVQPEQFVIHSSKANTLNDSLELF
ncbi:MAG: replicative DNA helicase [Candidatus Cardinium sp.]|uniref:replicative DNA helicase n=1 Tax=Candidatus Cardinium sp. TP TaxID=2961955 RepID=UPI0021AFF091|nr:replicative DNA helicase [Candidatus Cardinium sp. TP]MCT4697211.1 replicative DNA helicase [Candidatus Cardinium sp. TP]MDN5247354.1 replicative DNA helicase [Candidatus Cardinium sp.]